jgi:predicted RNase H-like HicB family nuclease
MSQGLGNSLSELSAEPVYDAAILRRAADLAGAYQVVLRCEKGRYYGFGLELPDAINHGATPEECVRATRDSMTQLVARMLRAGLAPPAPTLDVDRNHQITVRVTPAEQNVIERVARAHGCRSAAEYLRQVCLERGGVVAALPRVVDAPAPDPARQLQRIALARLLLAVTWLTVLGATLLVACRQVESVLVTGPVLLFGGMALATLAAGAGYRRAMWIGVGHCALCLFGFLLVSVAGWGPPDAREPLTVIGAIYMAAMLPASAVAWANPPREIDPGVCVQCGYSLFGLHEPRCPECGTPFDPKLLLTLTPLKVRPRNHPA